MTFTDTLKAAHDLLRKAVPIARRKARAEFGVLAQTYHAAMASWDQQKADGVSLSERLAGLEKTLRASWPQTREWHHVCESCNDTGWIFGTCVQGSCGRPFTRLGQAADDWTGRGRCTEGHSFVKACWCPKGRAFVEQPPRPEADAIAKAARTSKPMSRMGR